MARLGKITTTFIASFDFKMESRLDNATRIAAADAFVEEARALLDALLLADASLRRGLEDLLDAGTPRNAAISGCS